jgi:excisionase family DNA binding protein
MDTDKLPEILTLSQACKVINCHPNTLRNWDKDGTLVAIRFGKRGDRRYKKAEVLKLLENQKDKI